MRLILTTAAIAVMTTFALAVSAPAFALHGGGGGGGQSFSSFGSGRMSSIESSRSFSSSESSRGSSRSGEREDARTPPGWSHGKKKGWHGAKMPPGLSRH